MSRLLLLSALLSPACARTEAEGDSAPIEDTGTPDTLDPGTALIADLTLEPAELVPTVATVRWRTAEPMRARLTLTVPGEPARQLSLPDEALTEHEAVLVGIPEGEVATFVVEVYDDDTAATSEPMTFTAGLLDAAIPRPTRSGGEALTGDGFVLVPVFSTSSESWITLLDPAGRMVWAMADVDRAGHRARLLPDGSGVAWLWENMGLREGGIQAVRFDGTPQWRASAETLHQDFDLLDSTTALILSWELVEQETDDGPISLLSDRVVTLSASGEVEAVWRLLDDVPYAEDPEQKPSEQDPSAIDWAHVNFLELHEGAVYLTALIIDAVMVLDLDRRQLSTLVSGGEPEDGLLFDGPHSAWPTEDGLLVFNHRSPTAEACSEVLHLSIDGEPARGASFPEDDCYRVSYLGNAQLLPGGASLVSWSHAGVLSTFSSIGAEQAALTMPLGATFGYAEWVPDLGAEFSP